MINEAERGLSWRFLNWLEVMTIFDHFASDINQATKAAHASFTVTWNKLLEAVASDLKAAATGNIPPTPKLLIANYDPESFVHHGSHWIVVMYHIDSV